LCVDLGQCAKQITFALLNRRLDLALEVAHLLAQLFVIFGDELDGLHHGSDFAPCCVGKKEGTECGQQDLDLKARRLKSKADTQVEQKRHGRQMQDLPRPARRSRISFMSSCER
jgi:hypothetical protein